MDEASAYIKRERNEQALATTAEAKKADETRALRVISGYTCGRPTGSATREGEGECTVPASELGGMLALKRMQQTEERRQQTEGSQDRSFAASLASVFQFYKQKAEEAKRKKKQKAENAKQKKKRVKELQKQQAGLTEEELQQKRQHRRNELQRKQRRLTEEELPMSHVATLVNVEFLEEDSRCQIFAAPFPQADIPRTFHTTSHTLSHYNLLHTCSIN